MPRVKKIERIPEIRVMICPFKGRFEWVPTKDLKEGDFSIVPVVTSLDRDTGCPFSMVKF